ncbi:hypothetical protein HK096_006293 [Nowakowskiella sp. JEL0078]|nr:hypothetical protein HK096_006293 [Nowakowskiella sp. JEL0078]
MCDCVTQHLEIQALEMEGDLPVFDIAISYIWSDAESAQELNQALEEKGLKVWKKTSEDVNFDDIASAIRNSVIFVPLLSHGYFASGMKEFRYAVSDDRRVIGVCLDDSSNEEVESFIESIGSALFPYYGDFGDLEHIADFIAAEVLNLKEL